MYTAVIIDDEIHCIEVMEILLSNNYPEINIVGRFNNPSDALIFLKANKVDLVFLDIQMPVMTGLDLIAKIPNPQFYLIFTTAYDQYALEAFKHSALDYLLKPIDEDMLRDSIEKFKLRKSKESVSDQIVQLLKSYPITSTQSENNPTAFSQKISVGFLDKIVFYEPDEINYCHSNDNYTTLILKNGERVLASKTIKHFDELLSPMGFIRPHQSYLVNSKLIKQYSKKDGGFLILADGTSIPVSRNRKEEILQMFKGDNQS